MQLRIFALALGLSLFSGHRAQADEPQKLLHVSFGFTKAFYADYNAWFIAKWQRETGQTVVIEQSHAASGTQTEAVIAGKLSPDILSLASPDDIDAIAKKTGLVGADWQRAFPDRSSPYYSAVVFVVRRGNPKAIKDWADLALPDRTLVTSDPKACGGGRWSYAAAFGLGGSTTPDQDKYLTSFVNNIPVLYANQGAAAEAFLKDGNGDVLLTYESFGLGLVQLPSPSIELVLPPRTVEIELPVAIARKNTDKNKTTKLAEAYVRGLYDPEVQALFAKHNFRPRVKAIAAKTAQSFPAVTLVQEKDIFPARDERTQLADGGNFDGLISRRATK
jgi:sulfate transport system substrate-binding protein